MQASGCWLPIGYPFNGLTWPFVSSRVREQTIAPVEQSRAGQSLASVPKDLREPAVFFGFERISLARDIESQTAGQHKRFWEDWLP